MSVLKTYDHMKKEKSFAVVLLTGFLLLGNFQLVCGQGTMDWTNRCFQVVAPASVCAAVSDELGLLAIGFHGPAETQLAVYKLDGTGTPVLPPVQIALPCAEALKSSTNYALSVAFHPKLPLLYVWQDLAGPALDASTNNPAYAQFDHLLIYAINNGQLQLIQRHACGVQYACGKSIGSIALDPAGKRIFLPNLRDLSSDDTKCGPGYFTLDTTGMPQVFEEKVTPTYVDMSGFRSLMTGRGIYVVTDTVAIVSGVYGLATWDTENRRAVLDLFLLTPGPTEYSICGHPRLPVVYGVQPAGATALRMEHADGYLTMLPQTVGQPGATFQSLPVVMAGKTQRLVVGGPHCLYALPLDADGKFTGTPETFEINSSAVLALAYSMKYDRLYAGVEKAP